MEKQEILNKLFSSKWNYAWGRVDKHLVALFYEKGGFGGLLDFISAEKERMDKDEKHFFSRYYSKDLTETLDFAVKELTTEDFEDYIDRYNVEFNKHNLKKLKELDLVKHFREFNCDFRGNIQKLHTIGDINILEVRHKNDGDEFYIVGQFSTVFSNLNEAVLYAMYDGKYFDTLKTLLNSTKEK